MNTQQGCKKHGEEKVQVMKGGGWLLLINDELAGPLD